MTSTLLCIAPGCSVPRHHTKICTDDDCRGCLPAEASVGCLCERDFNHGASVLAEIGEFCERLAAGWPDASPAHDPLSASIPAGPVSRNGGAPKVSGTPGRSVPTSLDVLDLLAPARIGEVSSMRTYDPTGYWTGHQAPTRTCRCGWPLRAVEGHKPGPDETHDWRQWHDQAGQPSVAAVLDLWARDWHTYTRDALPDPTVPDLLRWLRARWEWAAKNHPAVDDFIRETGRLRGRLMAVLGEREPLPEPCLGVACRKCDERNLWRRADGSGDVDCHSCGLIYRPSEYAQWTSLLAASARRARVVDPA